MEKQTVHRTELKFEKSGSGALTVAIEGIGVDLATQPEKVRQLMELLDLPKGTKATVTVTASTSMIR